jgi:arylsulfatase A-like enzyme
MFVDARERCTPAGIRRRAAILAAIGVALTACSASSGDARPKTQDELALELDARARFAAALGPTRLVRLGPGQPALQVLAHEIEGAVETPRALRIPNGARLEVLTMVEDAALRGERCTVSALVDNAVKPLAVLTPLVAGRQPAEERFAHLDGFERLSLASFSGQDIRLRFELSSSSPGAQPWLLSARLVVPEPPERRPPDVLLVCADTLRYDCSIGSRGVELMPSLARLAASSTVFHAAYSGAPWTLPSITTALTGLYPRFHGTGSRLALHDGVEAVPAGYFARRFGKLDQVFRAYPDAVVSLGNALGELGYQTWMAVSNPLYSASGLLADGQEVVLDDGVVSGEKMLSGMQLLLEHRDQERPLFLLVHLMDVHQWKPWYYDPKYPNGSVLESPAEVAQSYDASVRDLDRSLGGIVDLWNEKVGEDSLIFFYADHGEHLLEGGGLGHGDGMTEELLHVPLVARFPSRARIVAGSVDAPVSLVDLMPTVLSIADHPDARLLCSGRSLADLSGLAEERTLYSDYPLFGGDEASVRRGRFKLRLDLDAGSSSLFDTGDPRTAKESGARLLDDEALARELNESFSLYEERGAAEREILLPTHRATAEENDALDALGYR